LHDVYSFEGLGKWPNGRAGFRRSEQSIFSARFLLSDEAGSTRSAVADQRFFEFLEAAIAEPLHLRRKE
jgi:hypothetical protein